MTIVVLLYIITRRRGGIGGVYCWDILNYEAYGGGKQLRRFCPKESERLKPEKD
ncbi:MAG: hypothetical protein SVO26_03925 [Chloroflexota bacterium]|nr:hypothetical protein [Chloroflexota bacterium]